MRAFTWNYIRIISSLFIFTAGLCLFGSALAPQNAQNTAGTSTTSTKKKRSKKASTATTASANDSAASASSNAAAPTPAKPVTSSPTAQRTPPPGNGMVWVNTDTHVYHRQGDRWYGKTKNGKYMPEADAVKAGYRPAQSGK